MHLIIPIKTDILRQDISGVVSGLTGMGINQRIGLRLIGATVPRHRRRIMGMGLARRRLARRRIMGSISTPDGEELEEFSRIEVDGHEPLV